MKKCISIFIFIVHVTCGLAQTPAEIDHLIQTTDSTYRNAAFEQTINNSFELLRLSEKIHYEKGIVNGYKFIADCLSFQGEYDKSLEYLKRIHPYTDYLSEDHYEHWYIQNIELNVLQMMGLHTLAKQQLHESIVTISRENDPLKQSIGLFNTYISAAAMLDDNPDTSYYYYNKAREVLEGPGYALRQEEYYTQDKAALYIRLGNHHFLNKNPDSALYYFKSAEELIRQLGGHYYEAYAYNGLGMVYLSLKRYPEALEYKLKALEIYKRHGVSEEVRRLYEDISNIYATLGNGQKEREYLKLSNRLQDSLGRAKAIGSDMTILNLVQANEKEMIQKRSQHRFTVGCIVAGSVLILIIAYYFFCRFRKRKEKLLHDKQELLEESRNALLNKEKVLSQLHLQLQASGREREITEEENKRLKQKASDTFEELIQMVRENNAQFWPRFHEVYPDFTEQMLSVNPALKTSELTFCAYIYLGFGTKQIAAYTYKALKTIENNRYNIRKRLGLSPEEDLALWIQNLYSRHLITS